MKKVKITLLRRTFQEDLAKEYGVENFKLEATDKESKAN